VRGTNEADHVVCRCRRRAVGVVAESREAQTHNLVPRLGLERRVIPPKAAALPSRAPAPPGAASDTISTSRRAKSPCMVWVWVVTTAFVVVTFIIVKRRGYKKMPHALRDAIAANAIFGALLLLHALL
jgi:hypothetical protein